MFAKNLAVISDARLGTRADQATIAERLLSISGEDTITIDRKFKQAWTGQLTTRFMLLSNELPRLTDASGALAKRFLVLVLTESFYGREDKNLLRRLIAEAPGILNWSLEGYCRLRERGHFVQPKASADAIAELEALSSPIKAFVADRCVVEGGATVEVNVLYDEWREWCQANGRREPGTKQTFGRDIRAAFPAVGVRQHRDLGDRHRSYEGIRVQRH